MIREILYVKCDKCGVEELVYDDSVTAKCIYPLPGWEGGLGNEADYCPSCRGMKPNQEGNNNG